MRLAIRQIQAQNEGMAPETEPYEIPGLRPAIVAGTAQQIMREWGWDPYNALAMSLVLNAPPLSGRERVQD